MRNILAVVGLLALIKKGWELYENYDAMREENESLRKHQQQD